MLTDTIVNCLIRFLFHYSSQLDFNYDGSGQVVATSDAVQYKIIKYNQKDKVIEPH